jgi:beta-phosphoglucomutase-like phosphatase (HAD superfamily)
VGADLYVEDSPENVRALRAGGHATIVFENSTNQELAEPRARTWGEAEAAVGEALARWEDRRP